MTARSNPDQDLIHPKFIGGALLLALTVVLLGMPLTLRMIEDVYVDSEARETQNFHAKGCVMGKTEPATFRHNWRTWECKHGVSKQLIHKS